MASVRKEAPQFTAKAVVNGEIKPALSLSDYKGKYVVLLFYPLDFTSVCHTEVIAYSDRVEEFRKLGVEVLTISVDSVHTHLAWVNTPRKAGGLGPMQIPILADLTHKIAKDYGVYLEEEGFSMRGLIIIDGKGIVRQITINDIPVGRNVDETLRLIQALQYSDVNGEVLPCDWVPGKVTIKPQNAKEYYEETNKK